MLLTERVVAVDVVSEITTLQIIHEEVQVVPILEGTAHVYYEVALPLNHQFGKDLSLVDDGLDTLLGDHPGLIDDLQSVDIFALLLCNLPNPAETTFTDNPDKGEHGFVD